VLALRQVPVLQRVPVLRRVLVVRRAPPQVRRGSPWLFVR
jgi:hypothetical protein